MNDAEIQRGEEASRVLNSDVFQSAFRDVREAYLKTIESLPSVGTDDGWQHVADLHSRLKVLSDVRKAIETHIQTGKLAQKERNRKERAMEYMRKMNPFAQQPRSM